MNQKGAAPVLLLIAIVGLFGFLIFSSLASFKDKNYSTLFPKKSSHATGSVEVYPGPGVDTYKSNLYSVEVFDGLNWISAYVYKYSRLSRLHWHGGLYPSVNFLTFGTTGQTNIRITKLNSTITSLDVSPKSKNIPVKINNGQATLTLTQNDKAWITINDDDANPLFVFADPPKPIVPAGATYFGPGIREIAPTIGNHYKASSNEVIYLDGGAWMKGNIDIRGSSNVQIMGPGVLSGELWTAENIQALPSAERRNHMMVIGDWSVTNGNVQGVTMVNSPTYNIFGGIKNATNVKLISPWYWSTDGFTNVTNVDQSFAFIGDNVFFPAYAGAQGENITMTNSFVGNTNNGVFSGGYWGQPATNTYSSFADNIDIKTYMDQSYGPSVFQIWVDSSDSTKGYSNQTYQNIRVDGNLLAPLMQLKNTLYPWDPNNAPNPPLGNSYNLIFKNISVQGTQAGISEIKGYDANNGFHNVTIENLRINGNFVHQANFNNNFSTNSFVWGLKLDPAPPTIATSYTASQGFSSTQGANQWKYQYAAPGSSTYTPLPLYDTTNNRWEISETQPPWTVIWVNGQHPDTNDSVRTWVAPGDGTISITHNGGNVRLYVTPSDGVITSILKNNFLTPIWQATVSDLTGVSMPTQTLNVLAKDEIHFRVNKISTAGNDSTYFDPKITFTPASPFSTPAPTPSPTPTPVPTPLPDTQPPTVNITYPTNGAYVSRRTNITVTATASDNIGVTKVEFRRNGALVCTDTTAPYSCSMYTDGGKNVRVTFEAKAFDRSGNTTTSTVTVTSK